ncbi:hypothetical protein WJX72_012004 [[Myrmecia] bisecta]|uniref:Disease resistance protein Roq1-like winged-helix domain-containing protein n=1 Tax=[Myrmecia] bisecta TaxID=41462 RepID=A0AAW1PU43_9CHLO
MPYQWDPAGYSGAYSGFGQPTGQTDPGGQSDLGGQNTGQQVGAWQQAGYGHNHVVAQHPAPPGFSAPASAPPLSGAPGYDSTGQHGFAPQQALVAALSDGAPLCQEYAAGALRHLATTEQNKAAIMRAGAVQPLAALLLSAGNPASQAEAAGVLAQLATDAANPPAMLEAGVIKRLYAILVGDCSSSYRATAAEALQLLQQEPGRDLEPAATVAIARPNDQQAAKQDEAAALLSDRGCAKPAVKASAPAPDPALAPVNRDYDVFISHRGPDTKLVFVGHASWWCMEELRIATTESKHKIKPVFFIVKPGSVNEAALAESLADMQKSLPATPDSKLQEWRDALTWVKGLGGVSGWLHDPKKQSQAELVEAVTASILGALDVKARHLPAVVGLDARVLELVSGLQLQDSHVLGTFLKGKRRVIWEEMLERLRHARDLPVQNNDKVFQRLRISYDGLGSGLSGQSGLSVLIGQCLVSVDKEGYLAMHDQLRDMGRAVEERGLDMRQDLTMCERKRLTLTDAHQLQQLLARKNGPLSSLEGLWASPSRDLPPHLLEGCSALRLLMISSHVDVTGMDPKQLRYLRWLCCPFPELPIDLSGAHSLAVLELGYSEELLKLPDKVVHANT